MSDIPPDCTVGGPAHRPGPRPDGEVRCMDCKALLEEPICDDCGRAVIDCDADHVVGFHDDWDYVTDRHYTTEEVCPRIVRENDEARADHMIGNMEEGA